MKTILFIVLTTLLCLDTFSQITFEKGYFINDSNRKTECLIKNVAWKNNPTSFEYKEALDSPIQKKDINTIKEFGITNSSKYIKAKVQIDRSSNNINKLSTTRKPIFKEEQLFLKVLIEGKASLFFYQDGNITRFFFQIKNDKINQLVYKKYLRQDEFATSNHTGIISDNHIMTNKYYQQQLINSFKDQYISTPEITHTEYKQKSLSRLFLKYNGEGKSTVYNNKKENTDNFRLSIRPGLNYSNLIINNQSTIYGTFEYNKNITFRLGLEAEFFLPYNKNKWSIIIEPTYQYFKDEMSLETSNISGGLINSKTNYSSIEVPVGLRHYFYFKNQSKIFINASYSLDLCLNSNTTFTRKDGSNINELDLSSRGNIAFGAGYKLKKKYSIELRYFSNRNITSDYISWNSKYKTTSIIFGYTLF